MHCPLYGVCDVWCALWAMRCFLTSCERACVCLCVRRRQKQQIDRLEALVQQANAQLTALPTPARDDGATPFSHAPPSRIASDVTTPASLGSRQPAPLYRREQVQLEWSLGGCCAHRRPKVTIADGSERDGDAQFTPFGTPLLLRLLRYYNVNTSTATGNDQ